MNKIRKALVCCENCKFDETRSYLEPCDTCKGFERFELKPELELEAELKAAEEALEKQTAKYPAESVTGKLYCAECGKFIAHSIQSKTTWKHCPHCGQAFKLDWSV